MKNLSDVKTSMTYVLEHNLEALNNCKSVSELSQLISNLFAANNINTVASNRLITNVSKKHNIGDAQLAIYNSMLSGNKLSVIK